jgi:subtilisin family serine protease
VAATDPGDVRADFASYGSAVDLCAPGVDLHGAYPEDPGTAIWSGSSFSAALVSGAFALLREQHPTWSVSTLVDHVLDTSASISGANPNMSGKLGEGRLDLDAATEP